VYFAHFSRHTIPFDESVITGKVPIERYREEFPKEYARIVAAEGLPPEYREEPGSEEWQDEPGLEWVSGLQPEEQLAMDLLHSEEAE